MYHKLTYSILLLITLILFVPLNAKEAGKAQNHSDILVDNLTRSWTGDLDGMLKNRVIRVLVLPSKIMYWMDKGKKSGLNYELMMLFEKEINKRYPPKNKHLKTRILFIPVSKDRLIPALLEGRGDIAVADISITPRRKKKIDFSIPFASHINAIAVTGNKYSLLDNVSNLSEKEVYVHHSSSYHEYLEKMNFYFTEAGMAPIKIKKIPEQLRDEEIIEMLNAGLIQITIMDDYQAKLWSKVYKQIVLHPNIVLKENDEFAWMIRKNSPKLKKEINLFIKEHKAGTRLGNTLIKRYVTHFKFDKPKITKTNFEDFDKIVYLFKKYAEKYNINHMLMIAKAYQESKLDQTVKSKVGAIGVMQLMPATGKEMNVGDIHKVEPNINAGIKYHRWLIDHYFKDTAMDKFNQTFFAFAAYNAGPGRIRSLQKIAKKRGYDPNVWFNNVEVIAAEKIGAETVTYVVNIYEYYVAYYLYKETEKDKDKIIKKAISKGKI